MSRGDPAVRPATSSDAAAVGELAAMMAVSRTVEPGAFRRSFAAVLDEPHAHVLVVDSPAEVVGYLLGFDHLAFFANGPVGWVEEIAVQQGQRRRHLGSLLMTAFERRIRDRGGRLVALATARASSFYQAIGYDRYATYYRKNL